jgi:hypothetical protein
MCADSGIEQNFIDAYPAGGGTAGCHAGEDQGQDKAYQPGEFLEGLQMTQSPPPSLDIKKVNSPRTRQALIILFKYSRFYYGSPVKAIDGWNSSGAGRGGFLWD